MDVPITPGVTTYTAYVTDTVLGATAALPAAYVTKSPYVSDHIAFGGATFNAPAGDHQIPLAEVGSHGPCASEAGRFGLIKVLGDVGSACSPLINGSLRYKTGETVVNYRVRDIKRRCGRITVTGAGFVLAHLRDHPATQSGHFIVHARDCGKIILAVATSRLRNIGLVGQGADGKVALRQR